MSSIEYFIERKVNETIDIDDVGNTNIIASDDNGLCYGLCTKTVMAETHILQFGPQNLGDATIDVTSYSMSYIKMPFNKYKVEKVISTFLNGIGKNITQANEVSYENIKEIFDVNLFQKFEETT